MPAYQQEPSTPENARRLTISALPGIPEIQPGDDIAEVVLAALRRAGEALQNGDIIVLAQKIVSKSEGRYVELDSVAISPAAADLAVSTGLDPRVVELVVQESVEIVRARPGLLIVEHRNGFVMANGGIDASNVSPSQNGQRVLLLPSDPDGSAAAIRARIEAAQRVRIGLIINDSFGRAWRLGTIGTAIGVSGMPGLLDLRGQPDRNGRILVHSELGAADEVAAAASLVMGQASESCPAILVRGFPYPLREGRGQELIRDKTRDMFR